MAEQSVTLTPGESRVVSFEIVPHEARDYQVSVNGLTGSFMVIVAPSVEFAYVSAIRKLHVREKIYPDAGSTSWLRYEIDVKNTGNIAGECVAECYIRTRSDNVWTDWINCISLHGRVGYEPYEYDLVDQKEVSRATIQPGQIVTFVGYARFAYRDLHLEIKFVGDAGESPVARDEWYGFA